jgi:hypothetical protein
VRRKLLSLLAAAAILYTLYAVAMVTFQENLIFPRTIPGVRDPAAPPPSGWREVTVSSTPGVVVPAWVHLPKEAAEGPVPLVVFFHGNAEVIDDIAESRVVTMYRQWGVAVMLVEYRGYGRAGGTPTEHDLVADSTALVANVTSWPQIDATRVAYYGRSLGGGVACGVAKARPPAALILQSSFRSIRALAGRFLIPGPLVRHPFDNQSVVPTLKAPVLVLHGTRDDVIPVEHGRALAALAKSSTYAEQNARHNDFPADFAAYRETVHAFLTRSGFVPEGRPVAPPGSPIPPPPVRRRP